jgi:hypothetical protein
MKILLRYVPILAGILACGIVGMIGVMFAMDDTSGIAVKIESLAAFVVGGVVFYLVKLWLDKRAQQNQK